MSVFKVVTLVTYDCTEELLCDADDMIESIVCTPSPSFLMEGGGGGGGWTSNQIFKKVGAWQDLDF